MRSTYLIFALVVCASFIAYVSRTSTDKMPAAADSPKATPDSPKATPVPPTSVVDNKSKLYLTVDIEVFSAGTELQFRIRNNLNSEIRNLKYFKRNNETELKLFLFDAPNVTHYVMVREIVGLDLIDVGCVEVTVTNGEMSMKDVFYPYMPLDNQ